MREPTSTGQRVEVWNAFTKTWATGFEVAEVVDRGRIRVRRRADDVVLPGDVSADAVRPDRELR